MIFISYRRSDGQAAAQLLQKSLIDRGFSKDDIFLDLHKIKVNDFTERCAEAISECETFILLITKDSFKPREGRDFYWEEIDAALDAKKKIVPVLYQTTFDEQCIPEHFKAKRLHLKHSIRYDIEYEHDSMDKITDAITENAKEPIPTRIAQWIKVPLVFITIYLLLTVVGGVVRYVWDNFWLSDDTCEQIAAGHVKQAEGNTYYYTTRDSVYWYNGDTRKISVYDNDFIEKSALSINIQESDMYQAGFWTIAVALVYEVTKVRFTPHMRGKALGVFVAATICVAAGVGMGFVCERMMLPAYESRLIRRNLHSPNWWELILGSKHYMPSINRKF